MVVGIDGNQGEHASGVRVVPAEGVEVGSEEGAEVPGFGHPLLGREGEGEEGGEEPELATATATANNAHGVPTAEMRQTRNRRRTSLRRRTV